MPKFPLERKTMNHIHIASQTTPALFSVSLQDGLSIAQLIDVEGEDCTEEMMHMTVRSFNSNCDHNAAI